MKNEKIENAQRKIVLSAFKQPYSIPLYLVETFGDLNLAWFANKLLNGCNVGINNPIYILTEEAAAKLFKQEISLPLTVQDNIEKYFVKNGFLQEAGNGGYVVQIDKLMEHIYETVG